MMKTLKRAAAVKTFEDLECWKECRALRLFVAKELVTSLPKEERYRLGDQVLRAARSTTANIAEGYGRFHYLDNAKFCSNARIVLGNSRSFDNRARRRVSLCRIT